jgi:hypothetical protein
LSQAPPPEVIEIARKRPGDDRADQQAAEHLGLDDPDDDRERDRDQRGSIIFLIADLATMSTARL